MKATEFDQIFDDGGDVSDRVDWAKSFRPHSSTQRLNIDLSATTVAALDQEAARRGITRQALVELWIVEKIDSAA